MLGDKTLLRRIIDITYEHKLSHLSSCLTAAPIIDNIYKNMIENDKFILSSGHAGLALYCVLEKYYEEINAEILLKKHGIHPSKDITNRIFCSGGSLGSGILIAVGHAISNRQNTVNVLISDGECAEGSVWEALAFAQKIGLTNLSVHVNINGLSAYEEIDREYLYKRLVSFYPKVRVHYNFNELDFAPGLKGHYHIMNKEEYEALCEKLS